jgi:hypothetical protein
MITSSTFSRTIEMKIPKGASRKRKFNTSPNTKKLKLRMEMLRRLLRIKIGAITAISGREKGQMSAATTNNQGGIKNTSRISAKQKEIPRSTCPKRSMPKT